MRETVKVKLSVSPVRTAPTTNAPEVPLFRMVKVVLADAPRGTDIFTGVTSGLVDVEPAAKYEVTSNAPTDPESAIPAGEPENAPPTITLDPASVAPFEPPNCRLNEHDCCAATLTGDPGAPQVLLASARPATWLKSTYTPVAGLSPVFEKLNCLVAKPPKGTTPKSAQLTACKAPTAPTGVTTGGVTVPSCAGVAVRPG